MARKPLNPEEIEELSRSPYVALVANNRITFTPEFKRIAYEQLVKGKTLRTILEEHGIDTTILGDKRIWSMTEKLRLKADREDGFADLRAQNMRKDAVGSEAKELAKRIEQLEHELAYTRQEVEFLKKLRAADSEARRSWESKQRRK